LELSTVAPISRSNQTRWRRTARGAEHTCRAGGSANTQTADDASEHSTAQGKMRLGTESVRPSLYRRCLRASEAGGYTQTATRLAAAHCSRKQGRPGTLGAAAAAALRCRFSGPFFRAVLASRAFSRKRRLDGWMGVRAYTLLNGARVWFRFWFAWPLHF
jgi:hypothetical protein